MPVAKFTQSEIDRLISCPKSIDSAPSKSLVDDGAYRRNGAGLVATDGTQGAFSMYIRQNVAFEENFSVGLVYSSNDGRGDITLLRCNGKHGAFNAQYDPNNWHTHNHIHKASESDLDAGFRPEKHATLTTAFASLEEAVQYFLKTVNLNAKDAAKHFPDEKQGTLEFPGA
jgi:hypothetical protein